MTDRSSMSDRTPGSVAESPTPGRVAESPAPGSVATAPIVQPRLGPVGWGRWFWRQLTSMRTALLLLFLLAVAAVPGSVFPQRAVSAGDVAAYAQDHPRLYPAMNAVSLFNVYSSPWFSAIYLLLFISLVGCVLPRSRQHWAAMRGRPPAVPRRLERLPEYRTFRTAAAPEDVADAARSVLKARRYRLADHGSTTSLAAERGYLRETGNLLFHLSLVGILVAVAVGHLYGFRGNIVVSEHEGFADDLVHFDSVSAGPFFDPASLAPFTVTLDKFTARYQQTGQQRGAPREFSADVTVRSSPEAAPSKAVIASNHPLVESGTKVFLTGNGYAPRFTVRNGAGEVVANGPVPFLPQDGNMTSIGVVKVPDLAPTPNPLKERQLGLGGFFFPTLEMDPVQGPVSAFPDTRKPRVFLTAWVGDLGIDDGVPQSVYRLDTRKMTQLRDPKDPSKPLAAALAPGQTLTLPESLGTVEFDGVDRFVNFQVTRDPGRTAALVSGMLAVLGLMLSLFMRRRRVWVRAASDSDGRTVVEVAGLAPSETDGLAGEIDAVVQQVVTTTGEPALVGAEKE